MKEPLRSLILTVATGLVVMLGTASADTVTVTAEHAEIVSEPTAKGRVLASVARGTVLEVLGQEGAWIRVATPGTGYGGYIRAVLTQPAAGAAPTAPAPAPRPAPVAAPPQRPSASGAAPANQPRASAPVQSGERHPQEREGFWVGLGVGYGSDKSCANEVGCSGRTGSVTGFLKLGGTFNRQILLGVESNAWVKSEQGATVTLGNVSGTVTLYPRPSSGFFLKGGLGLSYARLAQSFGGDSLEASHTGWGFLAGVGYDLRVAKNVSLTPCFNYIYGYTGDIHFPMEGAHLSATNHDVLDFAVGVTFH